MITKDKAEDLVEFYLSTRLPPSDYGPRVVRREFTEDHTSCWICYWVLKIYIDTGDKQYRLGGNYPILVAKSDGSMFKTGFSPVEEYVEAFNSDRSKLKRIDMALM